MNASAPASAHRRHNRFESFTLLFPTAVWLVFFIVIPLSFLIVYSCWIVKDEFIVRGFSLKNYLRFFANSMYPTLLWNTAVLAFEVSALTFIMGYPLALFIPRRTGRARAIFYMFVLIPLLTSYIVRIYAMRVIPGSNGVINNFLLFLRMIKEPLQFLVFNRFAIFLTLCVILSPFMVMPIFTSLEKIPRSLFTVFIGYIVFCTAVVFKTGIARFGALLAFVFSFDETLITFFVIGPELSCR